MNKSNSPFVTILPNIIAAILFFAGAYRFYGHDDGVGMITFIFAGAVFLVVGFINMSNRH